MNLGVYLIFAMDAEDASIFVKVFQSYSITLMILNQEKLDTVSSDKFKDVVDACTLCDMCFLTKCPYVPPHEFNIDFPHLMLRYRVAERNKGKNKLIDDQLTKTDRNGKFFSKFSNLANWSTKTSNKITRPIMEMLLKIDKEAELPKFYKETLIDQVDKKKIVAKKNKEKVIIFPTCFVNYNNPDPGFSCKKNIR